MKNLLIYVGLTKIYFNDNSGRPVSHLSVTAVFHDNINPLCVNVLLWLFVFRYGVHLLCLCLCVWCSLCLWWTFRAPLLWWDEGMNLSYGQRATTR